VTHRFAGIYPILYAFYGADGRVDAGAMRAQVEHCVAAGAHGIAVLGLVTEVNRLDTAERRALVETVGTAIGGRVPYAVTVGETTVDGQIEFARMARANGASWAILQPPPGKSLSETVLHRHFGAIADALDFPVAIQNNPVNLDSSLSPESLAALVARHANIALLKAEGWSVDIATTLSALDGKVDAFGGHGGLEFLSLLRSGGAGLIPAPDCVAIQVAIYEAFREGTPDSLARAERLHRAILPLIVFMTRGVPGILCYGKRLMARRLGMKGAPHDRAPAIAPTEFGMAEMERLLASAQALERELGLVDAE
jgi:2-keto-3-deoxy-L-arabinonate dehydratase